MQWLMGEVEEVTGYWANLNHPEIEVEDTAVAALRFRGGGTDLSVGLLPGARWSTTAVSSRSRTKGR